MPARSIIILVILLSGACLQAQHLAPSIMPSAAGGATNTFSLNYIIGSGLPIYSGSAGQPGIGPALYIGSNASTLVQQIANMPDLKIQFYPNPVLHMLHLTASEYSAGMQIRIVNMLGQTTYMANWNGHTTQVDMSHMPAGYYNVIVNNNHELGRQISFKISKQ